MSLLGLARLRHGPTPPCQGAPIITSISADGVTENTCLGGGVVMEWTLNITGALQAGQEYYWEQATNEDGDNWAYWGRGTSVGKDKTWLTFGSDGAGAAETLYHKVRVWVVPTDGTDANACSGPDTSAQQSEATNECTE